MDLVVAGGGLIGLACALEAAADGREVLVVDAGGAERASEVAAGMIAPVGEASWGVEGLLAAGLDSARRWPEWAERLEARGGEPVGYRRCGSIHVALDRDEAAELRRIHALHDELGLGSRWLTSGQCRRLEPGLSTDVGAGFEAPGEAEVDPRVALAALRAGCAATGVRVEAGRVQRVLIDDGAARGVELEDGAQVRATAVLLAAGARLGALCPAGAEVPVRPVKGEVVRLRARPGEQPCERIVGCERVYVVPRASGEVVVGATVEDRGFDLRVTAGGVHELLREAYRAVPGIAELELVGCAAGLRPATSDNEPAIGWTGVEGLMIAGGHHRNGVLLTPFTAAVVGALLRGEEPPAPAAALSPLRFAASGARA
ncbi:MAG TPA: glycine oxidase ThiO [Solirubrobacterales bacterium]|nr:glycine oxidase ThiO [Solirubrobacterales bacterium]